MKIVQQLDSWSERFHSGFTDGLRIILGLILFVKGYEFIFYMAKLQQTIQYNFGYSDIRIVEVLAGIHLFIGFFIIIGLATRLACLIQIPIVTAAIFFVNSNIESTGTGELMLSIVTLFLLIFFLVEGNGEFSVYNFMINSNRSRITDESEEKIFRAAENE